ncbi:MAG: adenylate/guanylate cyclase domain-containing protein, partial [bacterium]|nr:adenylate/guanylate cyclase domain-containing protein [bacterium]
MNIERVKTKKRPVAATISLIILFSSIILIPMSSNAQIITKNLKNLRTKINNHPWSFRPGDSLSWAEPELAPEDAAGWIDNMDVQLAWTRYRDKDGNRPFRRFSKYFKKYKGYGWYRTSFALSSDEMKNKFNNRDLILRLGKIGQADAVYLNGQFIGSTGLKKSTPAGAVLDDSVLYYDKMRLYKIPRELLSLTKPNIVAVRVFAKYNIAPGLSHGKYYIASDQKIERSKFWDDFKKIFVIALSSLLGVFYLYWQFLFLKDDRATVYFALASFAMAVNTFTQSRIIYSILPNSLSIKKMEFISIIIFAHLVIEFFVHFVRIDTFASKIIRRIWEVFGIGCVIAVAA